MQDPDFSVVFIPRVKPRADLEDSISALKKHFQLTDKQLSALFRQPATTIKQQLTSIQAKSMVRLLWGLGWHSGILKNHSRVYSTIESVEIQFDVAGQRPCNQSPDQLESLEFPKGWSQFDSLNPKATIQAGNAQGLAFCIVIPQAKSDFDPSPSHYSYSQAVLKSAVSQSTNCEILQSYQPRFAETTGWPLSLSEFILWDLSNGTHYLLAVYEGRKRFYSIYCWAGCGDFARFRNDFLFVIESFRLHDHAGSSDQASTQCRSALAAPVS